MRREFTYAQMGVSLISMILWFLLPVFSFVLIVPLFHITGWSLCLRVNQIMLISLALAIFMFVAALTNQRTLMIVSGLLQVVCIVLTVIFRKAILLEGNLKWIYTSAQLLITAIPNLEISGTQITAENLRDVVTLITDNYMQVGLGFILHAILTLIYVLIAFIAPQDSRRSTFGSGSGNAGGKSTATPTFTPSGKTGYKSRI